MELARLALALVALTCFLAGTASAQTQADFSAALDHKQDAVNEFKLSLERRDGHQQRHARQLDVRRLLIV
jgi:hypothetical protein